MKNEHKRMCAYCRSMKDKSELFRVVHIKGTEPYIDFTFKAQGRGAYVCKNKDCVEGAFKKHSLERSLSCSLDLKIYDEMSEIIANQQ